ncbi:type III pantothenate kinase [Thalassotalea psychrophila]|uniref:Type III pantothenate kinase n=1 Tax=Thalassotalea psychrophila TaxID=3065647 RepID=A0ABY9TSU2_9GAMM|nr:type III pantothenate kinase [Colwelliaceae bacterium SQ149]
MELLIDVGNTLVKYALLENKQLSKINHCSTFDFLKLLSSFDHISSIVIASVSNPIFSQEIHAWAESLDIQIKPLSTEAESFGVKNSYENYSTMGVDRWLAVLGAQYLYPKENLLIVDAGTAITFDVLDKYKQHQGGWIVPGVDMMMQALFKNTEKVFAEQSEIDVLKFGKTTSDNVNLGCWSTASAAVHGAVEMTKNTEHSVERVIFTGGNGSELNRLGQFKATYIDNLVFIGMKRFL